jgi:hypothetical protein
MEKVNTGKTVMTKTKSPLTGINATVESLKLLLNMFNQRSLFLMSVQVVQVSKIILKFCDLLFEDRFIILDKNCYKLGKRW